MTPEKQETSEPIKEAMDEAKDIRQMAQDAADSTSVPTAEEARDEMADLREAHTDVPLRTYVVQSGDYLEKIAKEVYGDWERWKDIYEANKDQIKDPELIHPGQELRIP